MDNDYIRLRSTYMATVTEGAENPPAVRQFLREQGYENLNTIRALERKIKAGNWQNHWHKHRRNFMANVTEATETALAISAKEMGNKAAEFLLAQVKIVEDRLPEALAELHARIDFMDDKALVQYVKMLVDLSKDTPDRIAKHIQMLQQAGDGKDKKRILDDFGIGADIIDMAESGEGYKPHDVAGVSEELERLDKELFNEE